MDKKSLINSKHFKTHTKFDGIDTDLPNQRRSHKLFFSSQSVSKKEQALFSLILHFLLKHYCRTTELESSNWQHLYDGIVRHFCKEPFGSTVLCLMDHSQNSPQDQRGFFDEILKSFFYPPPAEVEQKFHFIFKNFIRKIQNDILQNGQTLVPAGTFSPLSHAEDYIFSSLVQTGRYSQDFIHSQVIGSGGFGEVYKAYHKMDKCEYAVKQVSLKPYSRRFHQTLNKALIEVQALAKLAHPNVVSYKSAWIEAQVGTPRKRRPSEAGDAKADIFEDSPSLSGASSLKNGTKERNNIKILIIDSDSSSEGSTSHNKTNSNSFIVFQHSNLEDEAQNQPTQNDDSIIFKNDQDDESFEPKEKDNSKTFNNGAKSFISPPPPPILMPISHLPPLSQYNHQVGINNMWIQLQEKSKSSTTKLVSGPEEIHTYLYIQMELCSFNLRTWLDQRNLKCKSFEDVDVNEALQIFKQVLKGVDYIHSQGILHRDLKPQNILFGACKAHQAGEESVKIGDFGLARLQQEHHRSAGNSPLSSPTLTKAIGTVPYCAPEQVASNLYDDKVDIYSLGVILLELLHPFKTAMERSRALENPLLFAQENIMSHNPSLGKILLEMLSPLPQKRPPASELLHTLFSPNKITEEEISNLVKENEHLKSLLQEKEDIIVKLRKELETLKSSNPTSS